MKKPRLSGALVEAPLSQAAIEAGRARSGELMTEDAKFALGY